ncbi:anti-sigma factor [Yinghuangia seranimata]|uniref:anti-sigma factor n=1 Tax=Yinghuangia seranimata TaxID=408067 RepID=UPI00248C1ACD|nr:anti-sigma factor [Yinghuangia seranimata]MDI2129723.1 anti-sigma factor [Yinghuangia seranimata]
MNHPLNPVRRGDGEDVHALAGAYAVDALDDRERELVERHLEVCQACRDEVRELRETAARLAAATSVPPPDRLRERVLAEIGSVRQVPPRPVPSRSVRGFSAATRLPWLAAAAMFVVAVVLGVMLASAHDQDTRADRIAAVVTAADARSVTAGGPGDAHATVVASRGANGAVVLADGLPQAAPGHVYQVWFMADSGARSAGLLGSGGANRLYAPGLGDASRIGVTLEPSGGSPAPTTSPLLVMTLPV